MECLTNRREFLKQSAGSALFGLGAGSAFAIASSRPKTACGVRSLREPLAIAMWDFSWLLRHALGHAVGSEFADWDKVLDGIVERGYNAVRIDAFPNHVAAGTDGKVTEESDHWLPGKVAALEWEPEFYKYVRDSFAPVGLMVDYWNTRTIGGGKDKVPVRLVNDLEQPWSGAVTLRVKLDGKSLAELRQDATMEAFGTAQVMFDVNWPDKSGVCVLEAELAGADGVPVRSVREVGILDVKSLGLAFGRSVTASSVYAREYQPSSAVDGDPATYWSSIFQDDAWLAVDLGTPTKLTRINIVWEAAYAKTFAVQVSSDGLTWTGIYKTDDGKGGATEIRLPETEARHIRVLCTQRGTQWGNAIRELVVLP